MKKQSYWGSVKSEWWVYVMVTLISFYGGYTALDEDDETTPYVLGFILFVNAVLHVGTYIAARVFNKRHGL